MNKRGISPLIATVLLIGFTVSLAAIIINWGTSFTREIQEDRVVILPLNTLHYFSKGSSTSELIDECINIGGRISYDEGLVQNTCVLPGEVIKRIKITQKTEESCSPDDEECLVLYLHDNDYFRSEEVLEPKRIPKNSWGLTKKEEVMPLLEEEFRVFIPKDPVERQEMYDYFGMNYGASAEELYELIVSDHESFGCHQKWFTGEKGEEGPITEVCKFLCVEMIDAKDKYDFLTDSHPNDTVLECVKFGKERNGTVIQ